jgi:hypothetical protein
MKMHRHSLPTYRRTPRGKAHLMNFRIKFWTLNAFSQSLRSVIVRDDFGLAKFVIPAYNMELQSNDSPLGTTSSLLPPPLPHAPVENVVCWANSELFVMKVARGQIELPVGIFTESIVDIECDPDSVAIDYGTEGWDKTPVFTVIATDLDGKRLSIDIEQHGFNFFIALLIGLLMIIGIVLIVFMMKKVRDWWHHRRHLGTGSFSSNGSTTTWEGTNQEAGRGDSNTDSLLINGDFIGVGDGVIIA